jgi:hypothetical protein
MEIMNRPWFSQDDWVLHQVEAFHRQRVAYVVAGNTPFKLNDGGRLVVHMIPEQCVQTQKRFPACDLRHHGQQITALGAQGGPQHRFNVDGFALFDGRDEPRAYTQLFRDGRIEGVMSDASYQIPQGPKVLRDFLCEHSIIEFVPSYLKFCALIGLEAPVWLSAALTGCQGVRININRWPDFGSHTIDRDVVHLPEMEIPSLDIEPANFLRPMFDALWNAAGFEKSCNFDEAGNHRERIV